MIRNNARNWFSVSQQFAEKARASLAAIAPISFVDPYSAVTNETNGIFSQVSLTNTTTTMLYLVLYVNNL